ncbi:MAG TPA: VOC family protein [Candidatus Dormibacteraeota bacterium]
MSTTTENHTTTPTGSVHPRERSANPIPSGVDIGHVHMRAGDLQKIKDFYVGILGFDVVIEMPDALFLSAGGYHHHLAFNTWESKGGQPAPLGSTGLYHVAIRYPTRAALGDAFRRLARADWMLDGFNDHGTHEALYLSDPEGNGLELCWDRPIEEWPLDEDGTMGWGNRRLDLRGLFAEGADEATLAGLPNPRFKGQ